MKKWKSFSLILTIASTLIATSAVVLIVMLLNTRYDEALNTSTERANNKIVKNVKQSIEEYTLEMSAIATQVSEIFQNQRVAQINQNNISENFIFRKDVNAVTVLDLSGDLILKSSSKLMKESFSLKELPEYQELIEQQKTIAYSSPHVQQIFQKDYTWVISFIQTIEWYQESVLHSGYVLVDMNFDYIQKLCSTELGDRASLYILDENNEIVYHPNQQRIYMGIPDDTVSYIQETNLSEDSSFCEINNKKYVINIAPMERTGWKIVGVSSLSGMKGYDMGIQRYLVILIISMLISVFIVSNLVSRRISKPLKRLTRLMAKVETGDFTGLASEEGYVEVANIGKAFNSMNNKIDELMKDIIYKQEHLRKSEMKTLYSQINAHFLYNTLDSIIWMTEAGENRKSVKMLSALAQFFRLSISGGKGNTILVDEEIRHANNYLVIQRMRFEDQFDYSFSIDEEIKYKKTARMILQPIIENAIIHGVANLPYKGRISIKATTKDGELVYTIRDNGYGIKPDILENILQSETKNNTGIGIKNVNQRIQLMYGEEYGLTYQSELEEGTTVTVRLPFVDEL